ncbi:chorismate synthase [Butyrivibrio sp. INlla14]|uniref:chorismate synthase n=1 Tax=Butyrivibrio sp. INlla14 TaxID=1520808 RepID=UPI00087613C3|nr:chorismate synthase [Butyrivibrio sp. INlla14]SCY30334.1 chorismate synthase [Butyrivibrio sp. INlla14]
MSGSIIGKNIQFSTWGESHGKALGVVVDGFPAGMELNEEDIQKFLDRRKPGTSAATTSRKEDDLVEILSGVFMGKTTGTPISLMVRNTSQRSSDYSEIAQYYRPGHADYGFDQKYGFRDYTGGGRSSGRETIGRVAAGAICSKLLSQMGIEVCAYTKSIGSVTADMDKFDKSAILITPTAMPDIDADKRAMELIAKARNMQDSLGGIIECQITGLPSGIGEPVFDKLDALLARAVMSIGAVKAIEIGDGTKVSTYIGSENNDAFAVSEEGKVVKKTNHSGGILGGISDGSTIIIRAYVKPTPSIARTQQTINKQGENIEINIKGRHDPVVVPRAVVVVETMCAHTVLDLMISNMASKADNLINFYKK